MRPVFASSPPMYARNFVFVLQSWRWQGRFSASRVSHTVAATGVSFPYDNCSLHPLHHVPICLFMTVLQSYTPTPPETMNATP